MMKPPWYHREPCREPPTVKQGAPAGSVGLMVGSTAARTWPHLRGRSGTSPSPQAGRRSRRLPATEEAVRANRPMEDVCLGIQPGISPRGSAYPVAGPHATIRDGTPLFRPPTAIRIAHRLPGPSATIHDGPTMKGASIPSAVMSDRVDSRRCRERIPALVHRITTAISREHPDVAGCAPSASCSPPGRCST